MTDEEIDRFASVLKECERIRAMIAREEAPSSNGEQDGIPIAAAPPERRPPVLTGATAARAGRPPLWGGCPSALDKGYPPGCVEGMFCEVRLEAVLRGSL
jgi:hypothetical protein